MKSSRQDTQKVSFRFGETPFCVGSRQTLLFKGANVLFTMAKRAVYNG